MATGINSIEELDDIRLDLAGDYILLRDLDFDADSSYDNPANKPVFTTGHGWTALGTSAARFTGTFDGDGHTISNLYHNYGVNYSSFAGYTEATSNIKNVGFIDAYVVGASYCGIIAGLNIGAITNCYATGYLQGGRQLGGLTGVNYYPTAILTKCYTDVEVHGAAYHIGGLVGYHWTGKIDQCYTLGDVYGTETAIGAFVGESSANSVPITNSYARGDAYKTAVNASYAVSNFIGLNRSSYAENCYATGRVIYDGAADPTANGGVGHPSGTQGGGECVWDMETSLQATSGSPAIFTGKTTVEMQDYLTYKSILIDWDIAKTTSWVNEIWVIKDGKDYPELSWAWEQPSLARNKVSSIHKNSGTLKGESRWL